MAIYIEEKQKLQDTYEELLQYREKFLYNENFRAEYASECALVEFAD